MPFLLPVVGLRSVLFALGFHYHSYSCMLLLAIYLYNLYLYLSMFVVVCLYSKIGGVGSFLYISPRICMGSGMGVGRQPNGPSRLDDGDDDLGWGDL